MMGTNRTEKACATRKQLLEAALAVIGEKGYSAATFNEIVDAAGVSKGVAYYHFKSKAVMAESILEEGIGGLIEGFERISAEAPTAPEALTCLLYTSITRGSGSYSIELEGYEPAPADVTKKLVEAYQAARAAGN